MPPPFNHEHTIFEDVLNLDGFDDIDPAPESEIDRPQVNYIGGPLGPVPPVVVDEEALPYTGRVDDVGPYEDIPASRWSYVHETVNPAMNGQMRERLGSMLTGEGGQTGADTADYGDAPSELGYPTSFLDNGARHFLPANSPILGACVDHEMDAASDIPALADDMNGSCPDDDDGVLSMSDLRPQQITDLRVSTVGSNVGGYLQAWMDFNRDGDFSDPGEQIVTNVQLIANSVVQPALLFETPAGTLPGPTYLRLRFSSVQNLGPAGPAPDGEVEDYRVDILPALCPFQPVDLFDSTNSDLLKTFMTVDVNEPGPLLETDIVDFNQVVGAVRRLTLGPYSGGGFGQPLNVVLSRINSGRLEFVANPDSQALLVLNYSDSVGGLEFDMSGADRVRLFYVFDDSGISTQTPVTVELNDGTNVRNPYPKCNRRQSAL